MGVLFLGCWFFFLLDFWCGWWDLGKKDEVVWFVGWVVWLWCWCVEYEFGGVDFCGVVEYGVVLEDGCDVVCEFVDVLCLDLGWVLY